jgi:hypothetical protein
MPAPSIAQLEPAVREGLPAFTRRWLEYARQLKYYNRQGEHLIRPRSGEDPTDYERRTKLSSRITYRVIEALGRGLYSPGPTRSTTPKGIQEWYEAVGEANHLDDLLGRVDKLAWLHGFAGIQVLPGTGPKPVNFYPWRADEVAVFCSEDDPCCPWAVVTRSLFETRDRLRYQLWTDNQVRTYWSKQGDTEQLLPTGARELAYDPAASGEHGLGCLPFAWAHNECPVDTFYTPGLGGSLADCNAAVDVRLSDLDQAIASFCIPRQYSRNVSSMAQFQHRPGDYIDLVGAAPDKDADVFFRQPEINVDQVWLHIRNYLNSTLADLGLPMLADVGDAQVLPESGIAIAMRDSDLVELWQARHPRFCRFEQDLFRVALTVAGSFHREAALLGAAQRPEALEVVFPEPRIAMPTLDRDAQDQSSIEAGWKSRIMVLQERYGLTRSGALEKLRQIEQDKLDEAEIVAEVVGESPPAKTPVPLDEDSTDERETEVPGEESTGEESNPAGD